MRFSLQLPTDRVDRSDEFLSAAAIAKMARAAEQAGFDACFVTDHPAPDDEWLSKGGHHSLDPFVALGFAAAATESIRLHTNAVVLPYRNPFLTAKAAATLDVLSGGRLILGVVTGYLEGEFAALGADFEGRNERTDEAIEVIRQVWTDGGVSLDGDHFKAAGNSALPRPAFPPPIWVGGNSRRAIRRAVELGDGWMPFPARRGLARATRTAALDSIEELEKRIAYAREHASKVGRTKSLEICFMPFGLEQFSTRKPSNDEVIASLKECERVGVGWASLSLPCESVSEYCEMLQTFAADVLGPLNSA